MKKQVLIVEDDEMLNAGLCYNLELEGFTPTAAYDLASAEKTFQEGEWGLVLLDVNLPDGDGFELAQTIRTKSDVPIIFLTARDLDEDILKGFRCGADDYITKPFNVRILLEHIQAVLRRCPGGQTSAVFRCGNLVIDFENHTAKKKGVPLVLTPTEYRLLQAFRENQGKVLTRRALLERLWDNDGNFVDEHTLTINISRLRSKITDETYSYIKTVYGMGYKWVGEGNDEQ